MEAIATPGVTAPAWIMGGGQAEAGAEGGFGEALSRATVGATVGAEASTRVAHAGEAMPRALPAGGSAVPSLAPGVAPGVAPDATSVGAPQAAQQQAGAPDMPGLDAALATSPTATTEAAPPQLAGTGRASVQARANALAAGHHAMPEGPVAGAFPAQAAAPDGGTSRRYPARHDRRRARGWRLEYRHRLGQGCRRICPAGPICGCSAGGTCGGEWRHGAHAHGGYGGNRRVSREPAGRSVGGHGAPHGAPPRGPCGPVAGQHGGGTARPGGGCAPRAGSATPAGCASRPREEWCGGHRPPARAVLGWR
jgi:hypothetical protein